MLFRISVFTHFSLIYKEKGYNCSAQDFKKNFCKIVAFFFQLYLLDELPPRERPK